MRWVVLFALLLSVGPLHAAGTDPRAQLDGMFTALRQAKTPEAAGGLEKQILGRFRQSGSPSVELLMRRADIAYGIGNSAVALKLVTAVTDISPSYAEAWHVRAVLLADSGKDRDAIAALQKAILLNPRHFVAMSQLADMLLTYGDTDGALKLFRKVQALDPQYEGLGRRIDALSRKVEGQGI